MTTKHRQKDIERFDHWASTYEHSWLQRAFFDRLHQATLALAAGIREIARVLRPGGYFILVDASLPDWWVRVFHPKRFHGPAELRTLFLQAGLQVQRQQLLAWRRWLATVGKK